MKVATLFLAGTVLAQVVLGAAVSSFVGGYSAVSPDSADYAQCVNAAAFIQSKRSELAPGNLVACAKQVVNGSNFQITIQLPTGQTVCQVVYLSPAWATSPLTFQDSNQTC